jgi:hypothetical protein
MTLDIVNQVGQQRVVDELDRQVRIGRLHPLGAKALVRAKNWRGALDVIRWLNALDKRGKMSA